METTLIVIYVFSGNGYFRTSKFRRVPPIYLYRVVGARNIFKTKNQINRKNESEEK